MKISELGPRIYNYHRKDGIYRCWKKVNRGRKEGKDRETRIDDASRRPSRNDASNDGGEPRWGEETVVWGVPIPRAALSFGSMHGRCRK